MAATHRAGVDDSLRTVAVIGSGTMGAGIAQVCAQADCRTFLVDAEPAALARGMERVQASWQKAVAKGKATPEQVQRWRSNLLPEPSAARAAGSADLAIEAVPEDLALKRQVFGQLDAAAPEHAILASNTSSLSIAALAAATRRPQRVLGLHFFNPVPLMHLLEIVTHPGTAREVVAAGRAFGARLGKTVIAVKDSPGFATSRLGIVLGNEAMRMLEEGVASARDIDTAMRLGYGHPMGPLELSDLVGLDVRLGISDYLHRTLKGEHYKAPDLVRRLVAEGSLGKKVGRGLYDWSDGTPTERRLP